MDNDQSSAVAPRNTQTDMMIARQAQEVQVAMLAAKRFPRDEVAALNRIKATCQRPTLAEQAIYSYPRGGANVTGPSIRLAEALAQNWGNMDFGVIELERREGSSEMMAYAWDLETNTRSTKTFTVRHKRDTKQGSKDLTDERDIYEMAANQGARRMRSCIMNVIPGDVTDLAVKESRKTLVSSDKRSTNEIITALLKSFKEFNITKEQLEKWAGKQLTELLKEDLIDLGGVYKAIKDGQAKPSDYFKVQADDEIMRQRITEAESRRAAMNNGNHMPRAVPVPPAATKSPTEKAKAYVAKRQAQEGTPAEAEAPATEDAAPVTAGDLAAVDQGTLLNDK